MRVIKPIDWKGIIHKHVDERLVKGEFGEQFVKECLVKKGLRLERQEKRAPGLPDFRIQDTPMFVEVKTHEKKTPPVWQKPFFSMMIKMGWQIYIAQPRIRISEDSVVCKRIDWYRFMDNGRLDPVEGFPVMCH